MAHSFGGVYERFDGTFSVTPRMPLGKLDADQLEKITLIVRRFGLPGVQATTGQRISIDGICAEDLDEVVKLLDGVGNRCPHNITACRGRAGCKRGLQDTHVMAVQIESVLSGFSQMPAHLKVGLSGCPRCCGASYVKDIGLIGTSNGWGLVFGGNAGRRVRSGDELLTDSSEEKVLEVLSAVLSLYRDHAMSRERTARFVERVGIAGIKSII